MIHFFDSPTRRSSPSCPTSPRRPTSCSATSRTRSPSTNKEAAREGLVRVGQGDRPRRDRAVDARELAREPVGARRHHARSSPRSATSLSVIMVPKVEGPWDIHYVDRLLAQLEAKAGLERPILVHALLETALGVTNLEEIAAASPRMQGMSFGPADLAASRRMKTTRVGGGHPGYRVLSDPDPADPEAPRASAQQDLWHYSIGRMVDACTVDRDPAVLRPVRRHQGRRGLRDAVPRRVPDGLRRRLVAAPGPDRRRQEGLQPRPGRGAASPRRSSRRSPTAAACT